MKSLKIKIQAQKNSDKFIVIDPLYKRSDNLITYTSRAYETDQSSFNSLAEKLRPGKAL